MTTVKLKFRPSAVAGREGTLYYQIARHRAVSCVKTPYRIYPDEWDSGSGIICNGNVKSRMPFLQLVRDCVGWELRQIRNVALLMERREKESGETVLMSDILAAIRRIKPCHASGPALWPEGFPDICAPPRRRSIP